MRVLFARLAFEDFNHWRETDPDTFVRLIALIRECQRTPFSGNGKPEPLRGNWSGFWSRRLTREHRLVYRVTGSGDAQTLEIAQCCYHY